MPERRITHSVKKIKIRNKANNWSNKRERVCVRMCDRMCYARRGCIMGVWQEQGVSSHIQVDEKGH